MISGETGADAVPVVSIIIVNYDTSTYVNRCLESLRNQSMDHEVIVVDNPSGSDDASRLKHDQVIRNDANLGYGEACNVGAAHSRGRYICILNPDTVVPDGELANWVQEAEKLMTSGRSVGCVGPALLNENGTVQRSSYRFPNPAVYWLYHSMLGGILKAARKRLGFGAKGEATEGESREVDWVMGAAMFFPREVWERVGGFDPDYFLYSEDTDLCRRVRNAGYEIYYVPSVHLTHTQGEAGADHRDRAIMRFFSALFLYEKKHHPMLMRLGMRAAVALDMLTRILIFIPLVALRPKLIHRKRLVGYVKVLLMAFQPHGDKSLR